ncbi:substrate-binding domain-containing protein [Ottowia thiooxydans]|uniref:substrate-binding domain-containing protein n=1 Tax=Ottowia thiooxydans TaxID=219182 RepID=UPI00048CDE10|nr:substrate-binding domain-containing protein [Ottowia thiooxydans]
MTSPTLSIISSMATQKLLVELIALYEKTHPGVSIKVESVGGLAALKRVEAGEAFDGVALASDVIDKLSTSGHVIGGSRADLVRSGVAVAVRAGAPRPDISNGNAVKQAVLDAPSVGYSTGPSGVQLAVLFERWGIAEQIKSKLVVAPPGVPVGSLVASGEVALGFQQLSELMHIEGIDVIGSLPADIQITTVFSAGLAATSKQPDAMRELFAFLTSAEVAGVKRDNGMEPA